MRVPASAAHNRWHPGLEPVVTIAPGEELTLDTRDGIDGQLTAESTHADILELDLGLGHPLTGPVFVEGAEPGDVLVVELAGYETADFGVTAVIPGFGFLSDVFPDPYLVKWEIAGTVARSAISCSRRRNSSISAGEGATPTTPANAASGTATPGSSSDRATVPAISHLTR